MFLSPPLIFMYDEMPIDAFPFQQFYFNRARDGTLRPDNLYVYAYRNGSLGEDTYLKRALLEMETSRTDKSASVLLDSERMLHTSHAPDNSGDNLAFPTAGLARMRINTIVIQIQALPETDVKMLTGKLSWQSTDGVSQRTFTDELEFEVIPDGTVSAYRLAVGAFASWVFAEEIYSLRLRVLGDGAEIRILSVEGSQERFERTDEKKPEWEGFDGPLHPVAMPRYIRMPKEKLDYFLGKDEKYSAAGS